jgi:hypothetical protein
MTADYLGHGLPCVASHDALDRGASESVLKGESLDGDATSVEAGSNLPHESGSQFVRSVQLTTPRCDRRSPLTSHVNGVVAVGAKEQVVGADAGRVIATMTDMEARRDRPMRELPRKSMRKDHATMCARNSVAGLQSSQGPQPTPVPLDNPTPEPLGQRVLCAADLRAVVPVAGVDRVHLLANEWRVAGVAYEVSRHERKITDVCGDYNTMRHV